VTLRAFLLPLDQRERLREAGGPLADTDLSTLQAKALPVIEVDGQIVAYWPCFYALHLEPLWVTEDARQHPAVLRALLELLQQTLMEIGEPVSFAVIDPATPTLPLAERLGFARVPGDLYYVTMPAPAPVGG
jgi:hypothetical protein